MQPDQVTSQTPIFITGRFRSGTSFLWEIFNQFDQCCAWYEPLHPQLLSAIEHTMPKKDHVGIKDYWHSYRLHPNFQDRYDMGYATERLHLEAGDEYPELEAYIRHLIELSQPQIPVLQFNRMDFRLPWLQAKFPAAKIIHIKRNPLQLYHSQRKHIATAHRHQAHHWDAYELMPWCYALQEAFPFLLNNKADHAFHPFYLMYLLSDRMAAIHSDVSISLDNEVFHSEDFIAQLSSVFSLTTAQKQQIQSLTHVPDIPVFDEQTTAELAAIMTTADMLLSASGLLDDYGKKPLETIKSEHQDFWQPYQNNIQSTTDMLLNINQLNSELTRILAENKSLKRELEKALENHQAVEVSAADEASINPDE